MRRFISVLGVLSALGVAGVSAQEGGLDTGCLETCSGESSSSFETLGCTSAQDWGCLCLQDDFKFSVRDCSTQRCGVDEGQVQAWLSEGRCMGIAPPEETEEPTTAASEPAATTTAAAEEETSAPATTTAEPTEAAETTTEASSTTPEPTTSAESSDAAESTTASASETSETAAGETAPADETEDDDGEAAAAGGGLSQGAAVGIGVGVAVCVVAIAVVAIALLLRNRKRKQQAGDDSSHIRHNISRPMGDVGLPVASISRGSYGEKRSGDSIELTSHRYEDMVPRTIPRTMV
ncbi:hypothetical protein ACRE_023300 [Hapsidospora chrysogenum ATCC 11550]|uniref:CFEM domain-containing protein n=1 Tax=Hapsidospora chrysogenum (strain ATCC 11550 / CBS 779.69 / DSM 880 / IAM 14645 / JCM 23072 / IMI 49137) TaxID=857340 RepID=A0A086TBT9_HAPC1|nr:hypothetical protein ACRE_023300 [Hapsidospora chrysogenum ATCC 11550]